MEKSINDILLYIHAIDMHIYYTFVQFIALFITLLLIIKKMKTDQCCKYLVTIV